MARVQWRGVTVDDRTAKMLDELARLSGSILIHPTQGSYSTGGGASAGTHAGGGAVDLMHPSWSTKDYDKVVRLARKIGFAAWHRTPQQSNWPRHVHMIAVGCKDLSDGARAQVVAYKAGRNGLANGGPDDGPRDYVDVTWEKYLKEVEDDMAINKDDADLIATRIWRADVVPSPAGKDSDNPTWMAGSYWKETYILLRDIRDSLNALAKAQGLSVDADSGPGKGN